MITRTCFKLAAASCDDETCETTIYVYGENGQSRRLAGIVEESEDNMKKTSKYA